MIGYGCGLPQAFGLRNDNGQFDCGMLAGVVVREYNSGEQYSSVVV